MTYRLTQLHLCAHGSPTSQGTIKYACELSQAFKCSLRVTSSQLLVRPPTSLISGKMLARLASELEHTAAQKSNELVACVRKHAASAGLAVEIETVPEPWPAEFPKAAAARGRASDLNIVGLARERARDRWNIEAWLFETGRPCLLHPNDRTSPFSLECVVIAWDFSKTAARAVGDALPMLRRAKTVHILTVHGEKAIPPADPGAALRSYLAAHDVAAVAREISIEGRRIGRAIVDDAAQVGADLLVMGAFGHSRLQEFILGGATKEVLETTPIPVLMAH